ncbi:MAG: hypothetical protein EZS28_043987, partial [Streblomastix strix]
PAARKFVFSFDLFPFFAMDPEQMKDEALQLIKDNAEDKDAISRAVELLSDALHNQVQKFGELHEQCAEYYYNYGDALLRLFETEGLMDSEEKQDENEDTTSYQPKSNAFISLDDNKVLSADQDEEQIDTKDDIDDLIDQPKKRKREEDEDEKKQNEKSIKTFRNDEMDATKSKVIIEREQNNDTDSDVINNKDVDADADTLQIAWESLDSARVILSGIVEREKQQKEESKDGENKQENKSDHLQLLVKTILRLGDVGVETGRNSDAVSDYTQALELMKTYLSPDSRDIAGCHINIATALDDDSASALPHYEEAKRIYNTHLERITRALLGIDSTKDLNEEEIINQEKERKKITNYLEDITLRIEEIHRTS